MDLGINGKTALLVGGSRGLGRATAEALAAEGVRVALIAREPVRVTAAAQHIAQQYGVAARGYAVDLADAGGMMNAVERIEQDFGNPIDILLNNSGGPPPSGVLGVSPDVWLQQFRAMVASILRLTDRVIPGMRRNHWGRVLTVASTVVVEPSAALGISNTLRSALVGWSKTLASEVARDNITVNLLLPGQVATDRTEFLDQAAAQRSGSDVASVRAAKTRQIPLGRYGQASEFGAVAAFLASQQAAYVTGSMLRVDGGALQSV